jgi:sporulation protein YlmC with PRC-barrel domain
VTTTAPEPTRLRLGRPVRCRDGKVGRLADVVIEPQDRRVTHLVVEDSGGEARLVPVELLRHEPKGRLVSLSCSKADLERFEPIRSFAYVGLEDFPRDNGKTDIGVEETFALPSLGDMEFGAYASGFDESYGVTYDRIPRGSAELRRASSVVSVDGHEIGHVEGLLVVGVRVTHVVVEGELPRGTRAVAVPIDSVEAIETDRITVRLSEEVLHSLPGLRSHRFPFFA